MSSFVKVTGNYKDNKVFSENIAIRTQPSERPKTHYEQTGNRHNSKFALEN
jgi:hypothetical protein